jgi:flavin-dependent dehydrogenase
MNKTWDAIIVGARVAGSPLGMLLARKGYRVLIVDKATFPSDTLSTHVMQPQAGAAMARWGLLDRLIATGCPPIHRYVYDFGPLTIEGAPNTKDTPSSYCPRRTVLDKLLVDAAAEAGAEIREGFTVGEIVFEDGRVVGIKGHGQGGASVTERARVVVGADGWHSLVAKATAPERYHEKPPLLAAYYAYFADLPMNGRMEICIRPVRGFGAMETHDGLTVVIGGWPMAEFEANKKDVEGNYTKLFDLSPSFKERVRGARRESKIFGAAIPNYFRKPFGPGWALVGDAGYIKDSITAQGILNSFLDAERCSHALDQVFAHGRAYDDAMGEYQRTRDEHSMPMYEITCQIASLEPPPPEMQQVLGSIAGKQPAMDRFVQMNAGTITPPEFFGSLSAAA